jgi:hypothetical protein
MSRALGFVGLIIVVAIGAVIYMKQVQSVTPAGSSNPRATIDVAGVKSDLLSIGQAERMHMASQGKYVSLDELISSGELVSNRTSRPNWSYSADISDTGFKVYATYTGAAAAGEKTPRFYVDETGTVQSE